MDDDEQLVPGPARGAGAGRAGGGRTGVGTLPSELLVVEPLLEVFL